MRKILTFPRSGLAALRVATHSAQLFAFGASLAVTFCLTSAARAQTLAQQLVPTASSLQDNSMSGQVPSRGNEFPTVDAAYSVLNDQSLVAPAGFGQTRSAAYCPPSTNVCDAGCDVSWYVSYEALWLRRENDDRFSLSRNSFMPDFEYDFGSRFTVGRLLDCVNGWEAVYTGPFDWQRQFSLAGTANLQSNFQPSGGYSAAELTAFNSADLHTQAYRAQLNSFELNRRWWVWDVVSTMIGVRYVDYEEDYLFLSSSAAGDGIFTESVDNQMVGAQFGADFLYPVSLRANVGIRGNAGVYANFDERSTFLRNAGTVILNAGDNDIDVAGLIEMGVYTNYQIVPSIRLTAGYEFWYLPGIASIPEQSPSSINPSSGSTVFDSDDLFLHGGSVGVQVLY